jgi:hypothetical protein
VPEVAYNVVLNEATRFDANVDSGTSVSASGRRCLFPTELITKWHPETSVRSASQQRMDVLFIGTMILHTGCGQKIYIADSLCVPEMGDLTLISPKQLFHGSGIRTEFNDIRRLTLRNGEIVKFTETNKSYILKIRPLDAKLLRSHKAFALAPSPPLLPPHLLSPALRQISFIVDAVISPPIVSALPCTLWMAYAAFRGSSASLACVGA